MIVKVSGNVFIEVQFPRFSGDSVDIGRPGIASKSPKSPDSPPKNS